jgi:hypothetical protein
VVTEVYYPKGSDTQGTYDSFRKHSLKGATEEVCGHDGWVIVEKSQEGKTGDDTAEEMGKEKGEKGGYGFLVSIRFKTPAAAMAFYDALDVAKGPSPGTNFTLCCAYTLLAHYAELEWAAEYGVLEDLVRISVGLEEREWLRERVDKALHAAEAVLKGL